MSLNEVNYLNNIPVTNIWLLMAYASEFSFLSQKTKSDFIENSDRLPELVAKLLCDSVDERMRYGLTNGYKTLSSDLNRLRGKVDVVRTYTRGLLKQAKIACSFDKLSADTPRNRFVRAAMAHSLNVVSEQSVKNRLNSLIYRFDELGVSSLPVTQQELLTDRLGRHDQRDKEMIELAKMSMSFKLPSESMGSVPHLSASRNKYWVRKLFEKAIAGFYRISLDRRVHAVKTGKVLKWPISEYSSGAVDVIPIMKADIILETSHNRLIIDTKFNEIYKPGWMRDRTLRSGYLYQIYSYLRTQENFDDKKSLCSSGLLLHPSVGEKVFEKVLIDKHLLSFATIDLTMTSSEIKEKLLWIYENCMSMQ